MGAAASRAKGDEGHNVLRDRINAVVRVLGGERLARNTQFGSEILPEALAGSRPLSNMTMFQLLRDIHGDGATVYGLRSSFRDWALTLKTSRSGWAPSPQKSGSLLRSGYPDG